MKSTAQKPAEQSNPTHQTILERISLPVTILCIVVTALLGVFVFYHNLQREVWDQRLNQAKEELNAPKEALGVANQEIDKLKAELKTRVQRELLTKEPGAVEAPPGKSFQVTMLKSVETNFARDLTITLMDPKFHPDPARYTVTAKVQYKDLPEMQLRDAEEGAEVTYPKEHGYSIRVVKVDAVSAKLSITKNP